MSRYKDFQATGVAPLGVLYAGDLNGIQDLKADQANFAQTIDLSVLRIGEAALQLLRYGAGEARITGAVRMDGIVRALGGVYAGAFTDAQRDALSDDAAIHGLVILNATKNRLEWNRGTGAARDWQPLAGSEVGIVGDMPAPGQPGRQYWDQTNLILWVDTSTRWLAIDGQIGDITYYSGVVLNLAGIQEPQPGRLLLNGAVVEQGDFPDLYDKFGPNAYAVDTAPGGIPSFTLPNMLGRVLIPRDGAQAEFDVLGEIGGAKTNTLIANQIPDMPIQLRTRQVTGRYSGSPVGEHVASMDTGVDALGPTGNGVFTDQSGGGVNPGGGQPHNNLQPYVVIAAATVKY